MTSDTPTTDPRDDAFYAATVAAWYSSAFEHDKSILTLASGGIGLLVTLVIANKPAPLIITLYGIALLAFLASVFSILFVFRRNKTHLEDIIHKRAFDNDSQLDCADRVAFWGFFIGACISALIGILSALSGHIPEGFSMGNTKPNAPKTVFTQDSVSGAMRAAPPVIERRSVSGAASLRPSAPAAPSNATQPAAPAGSQQAPQAGAKKAD